MVTIYLLMKTNILELYLAGQLVSADDKSNGLKYI